MSLMTTELFGMWLLFSNLTTFMLLLLLGLDNTLPRILSYILAGATSVPNEKISPADFLSDSVQKSLLTDFLTKSRKLIFKLSAIQVVVVLLLIPYIFTTTEKYTQANVIEIILTWICYGAGIIFLFSFNLYNGLLRGFNEIWTANLFVALQRLLFLLTSTFMLLKNQSLFSISIAFAFSNFTVLFLSRKLINSRTELSTLDSVPQDQTITISQILKNTRLLALNSLSGFLILRFSMLASVLVLDLQSATEYNLTITLFLSLYGICLEIARNYATSLHFHQAKKNVTQLRILYRRMRFNTLAIFAVGGLALTFAGNSFASYFSPELSLLSATPISVLFLIYFLELNHTISSIYISSHNYFPMTSPVIVSGVLIVVIGVATSFVFSFWGFILSQGLIQLAYNNWKWPKLVRQELRTRG